jgi:transcriptional regulator with XRE-family HTH domain
MSEIRALRFRLGMTLDDLYIATNRQVIPSELSKIERGIVNPGPEKKELIAKALGVSADELFPSDGEILSIYHERDLFKKLCKVMSFEDRIKVLSGPGNYEVRLLAMAKKYKITV